MYGIRDGASKVVIQGLGIVLTLESTQAQFESALKHVPALKEKHIIKLTDTQIKERQKLVEARKGLKLSKNGSKTNKEKATDKA